MRRRHSKEQQTKDGKRERGYEQDGQKGVQLTIDLRNKIPLLFGQGGELSTRGECGEEQSDPLKAHAVHLVVLAIVVIVGAGAAIHEEGQEIGLQLVDVGDGGVGDVGTFTVESEGPGVAGLAGVEKCGWARGCTLWPLHHWARPCKAH